jgi:hypothetical protein
MMGKFCNSFINSLVKFAQLKGDQFLKFSFMQVLFSDTQLKILKECKIANAEDNYQWFTRNVIWPGVIIFIPVFIQLIFPTNVTDFKTLIFNGSISLVGINILFGMSTYLIKVNRLPRVDSAITNDQAYDANDEKIDGKLNQDVLHLRSRLDDYKNILVFIGGVFYLIQALFGKYRSDSMFYVFTVCTLLVLIFSIQIGRYMFIIKDDFFEKTFYGEMNEPVLEARSRWAQKY